MLSRQFKIEAVKLVTQQGYSVSQAAESLGIGANLLRKWREKFAEPGHDRHPRLPPVPGRVCADSRLLYATTAGKVHYLTGLPGAIGPGKPGANSASLWSRP